MFERQSHNVGKYTEEDVEKLAKLNEICPNDWKTIGIIMGRSSSSVKDRARLLKPERKSGQWSCDELDILSTAIHEVTKTKVGERIAGKINWKHVAEKVPKRTSKQCRRKWITYLRWKEANGKEGVKCDEIRLINKIAALGVGDEDAIKWEILAEGWDCVRSPQWLREKWWFIKKQAFKELNRVLKFPELLQWLQKEYVQLVISRYDITPPDEVEQSIGEVVGEE